MQTPAAHAGKMLSPEPGRGAARESGGRHGRASRQRRLRKAAPLLCRDGDRWSADPSPMVRPRFPHSNGFHAGVRLWQFP